MISSHLRKQVVALSTACALAGAAGIQMARQAAEAAEPVPRVAVAAQEPPQEPPAEPRPPAEPPPPQSPPAEEGKGQPSPPAPREQGQERGQSATEDESGASQQPTFRTGINFVRVDAIVTDKKGNPITDLTARDFELREDGEPKAIETFRLIRVSGEPEPGEASPSAITSDYVEEAEAARDDVRLMVIFLDDYHVRRGADLFVRRVLADWVENHLGTLDMVAVMTPLSSLSEVKFTRNRRLVSAGMRKFLGRKGDYFPRNQFEEQYANYPVEVVERIRNQVSLSALEGLMVKLGGMREGRKTVVLVSEGYSNYVPPQMNDPVASMPGMGNPNRGNSTLGGGMSEDRARFFANTDLHTELREVFASANRNNTSIYALDPRGLAAFEHDLSQPAVPLTTDSTSLRETMDTLRVLADETDGRAIVNQNDLMSGLNQMLRDSSAYYLLGYTTTKATDGRFHEIKVRVNRDGVDVRARRGYWAYDEDAVKRLTEATKPGPPPDVTNALAAVERPRRAQIIRTWVGSSPGPDGQSQVMFAWEPAAGQASERRERVTRVRVTAAGNGGAPYFRGVVPDAGSTDTQVTFTAPPGAMQVRLSAEGEDGGVVDSDLLDVRVPDFTTPEVQVATPAVYRVRTAVEFRGVSKSPNAVPTAAREFSRTERLLIRFAGSAPGGGAGLKPNARLLNRQGQPMSDLPVGAAPQGGVYTWQVDLPLAGLPPGDFLVELKATASGKSARELVGFRVGS
ncbi:MAG: VWA domain-containing protein [Luteitalea sp.]|nr:VWA domain-containing protein [Luteitalea sp.]